MQSLSAIARLEARRVSAHRKGIHRVSSTPHRNTSIFARLMLSLALVASFIASIPAFGAEKLTSEQVAALVPQLFKLHLRQRDMDVPFMKRMMKEFVNGLDPAKNFYLKDEAEALYNIPDEELIKIRDAALDGDFTHFRDIVKTFMETHIGRDEALYAGLDKRIEEVKAILKEADKEKAEKKADESAPGTEKKDDKAESDTDVEDELEKIKWNERPATHADREKRLMKVLSAYFGINKTYLSENDAFTLAVQTVREEREKWKRKKLDDETPKLFLKSFMDAMDPHTDYFDAEEDEEFTDRLERSFAGIGVQIRPCPLGAQIEEVLKGGPADKSKKFGKGDQIIAVDEFTLAGLPINKIVKRIKGKIGTEVKLTVLKRETKQTEQIVLKRDTIELAEMRVKGKKYDTEAGPIGLVSVQTFYRGVHRDVRDRIRELGKDKPLVGVVLDLRGNHGGYLEEAVGLAGLFIEDGPIVGEKDGQNKIDWKFDPDSNAEYGGPLVVLVNQFSASASEIVAGTLRDYGRAVVVGPTQTFGKGTVQRVIPLGTLNLPGEIKITTHQYFLAGGNSVQLKGVEPDVTIPGMKLDKDDGMLEASVENAIPFNKINGKLDQNDDDVKLWTAWKAKVVEDLQAKSKERVAKNPEILDAFDIKKLRAKARAERELEEKKRANPDQYPEITEKKEEKDVQADEAVAIVKDMVETWPGLVKQVAK